MQHRMLGWRVDGASMRIRPYRMRIHPCIQGLLKAEAEAEAEDEDLALVVLASEAACPDHMQNYLRYVEAESAKVQ